VSGNIFTPAKNCSPSGWKGKSLGLASFFVFFACIERQVEEKCGYGPTLREAWQAAISK
jgi:hypothetical protein